MTSYSERLAKRKQVAVDAEAALVAHFGPDAGNCTNWDNLWQRGWLEVLTNPAPTDDYQPKGLPEDGEGGWISENGHHAFADPPSLYSDKFLFHFASQLADDEVTVAARVSDWLEYADDMDCDQLSAVVGVVATHLVDYSLYYFSGTGRTVNAGLPDPARIEASLQNWHSKGETGLFISRYGVAVANRRPVPAIVVSGILQTVRRLVEARRQQWQIEAATQLPTAGPASTKRKVYRERKTAKLAPNIVQEEVRKLLTNLKMGSTYTKPGEWAAAFRALYVEQILTGNPYEVTRWATEQGYVDNSVLETFKKFWSGELNEASQFRNDLQKTVFRSVAAAARKLLETKTLANDR